MEAGKGAQEGLEKASWAGADRGLDRTKVRAEQSLSECTTGFSDQTRDLIGKIADVEHGLPLAN